MISPCYNSCSAKTQQVWKNEWLQLPFYNRKKAVHRVDCYNWTCVLTQNLQDIRCVKSVLIWSYSGPHFPAFGLNTERYVGKYDQCNSKFRHFSRSDDDCRCLFKKNTVPLKILDHCKWPPEMMMVSLKCMAASAPLETIRLK